jgi:hypothetical protein
MFRKKLMSRTLLGGMLSMTLVGQPLLSQRAFAAGGDFSLDFTAAAPLTYDHTTGGGAYNERDVGRDKDIVESLEGGDFACTNIVTYLTQIAVEPGAADDQTIELIYEFTAYSTGQQGVALIDIVNVAVNSEAIDTGTNDDGGSTASLVPLSETISGTPFVKTQPPPILSGRVQVNDLDPGETVVVRVDVRIGCDGQSPTGNMQARLSGAAVVAPAGEVGAISVGDQTINFKHVGDIKPPPPPK